ncbi:MAG: hypothetical protein LBD67_02975, partial [Candidatus Accumulibacter sp.]|nr:hypothetical protein [Accumulibacter sp.]
NALTTANQAFQSAQNAQQTADNAISKADNAQDTADEALELANAAHDKAEDAIDTANDAYDTAAIGETHASEALSVANSANQTANSANQTANTALDNSQTAMTTSQAAMLAVSRIGVFMEAVEDIDADEEYDVASLHVSDPSSTNFPPELVFPLWLEVFQTEGGTKCTQNAWDETGGGGKSGKRANRAGPSYNS